MLRIADGTRVFNVRAVAIVRHGDRVLVQRCDRDPFLTLPGGRLEWGESAAEALARELREEIGEDFDVGPLAMLVENFFALDGRDFHELDFYFGCRPRAGSRLLAGNGPYPCLDASDVRFEWADVDKLAALDLPLKPTLLLDRLPGAASGFEHVVHRG